MANVLAVDDSKELRLLLKTALEREGHHVQTLSSGAQLSDRHMRWADCIVLDVMMPDEDGFSVCRRIRHLVDCPILFLTARTTETDVITGFGVGGDDYITKPFRLSELSARINAHLRRERRTPHTRLQRGPFTFDLSARQCLCCGEAIHLTRGEYDLCEYLALHAGQTFSKEQIYEAVFGFNGPAASSAITEHVKNIRAKLRAVGQNPIDTVWGVGYKWTAK